MELKRLLPVGALALALALLTVAAPLMFGPLVIKVVQPWFETLPPTSQDNIRLFAKYLVPSLAVALALVLRARFNKRENRNIE